MEQEEGLFCLVFVFFVRGFCALKTGSEVPVLECLQSAKLAGKLLLISPAKMLILTLQGQSQGLWLWENTRLLPSTVTVKLHKLKCLTNKFNTTSISRVCYMRVACIGCIFFLFVSQSIHSLYIKCYSPSFHTKTSFAQVYFHNMKKKKKHSVIRVEKMIG